MKTPKHLSLEEQLCLKSSLKKIPLTANFEITPLCNLNCNMCYIRLSSKEQKNIHRLLTLSEWIDLAERFKKMGTLFILLTGGEPLIYPDFLQLYQELIKMGFILTLNTNGTLITEKIADSMTKHIPRRVNITLYGASNETYGRITGNYKGYDQTIRGILLLKERNIPIKLNCSMINANMSDTEKILKLSDELEIPLEYNTYMFPCSRRTNHLFPNNVRITPEDAAKWDVYIKKTQKKEQFFELRENVLTSFINADKENTFSNKMKCRAGQSSCWINWKGEMTPCVFLDTPSIDILKFPLDAAWNHIQNACASVELPDKCCNCRHRFNCNVCAASVKWDSNDVNTPPQYLCDYMDNVIEYLKNSS